MKIPSYLRWKSTERTLGQGGQASVVEVTDSREEYPGTFALKGLSFGKPRKAYERFVREIEALRSIDHPGIIRIVDHSTADADFHFYVMQLHEGAKTLTKLLGTAENFYAGDSLASLSLLMDILSAIQACEATGIVHRDLSPSNILVLPNRSLKIIDFGICQAEGEETITLTDEGVGTQNYMAPECESGATRGGITAQADIYSAGKITWSAMTNQQAFAREAPVFGPKSMKEIFPNDPAAWHLFHVFAGTIRNAPSDRWKTAADALREARRIRYLIMSHYPPLELLAKTCPLCGVGKLGDFQGSYTVFGNPNPPGISAVQCNYCGFCFARSHKLIQENMESRSQLR